MNRRGVLRTGAALALGAASAAASLAGCGSGADPKPGAAGTRSAGPAAPAPTSAAPPGPSASPAPSRAPLPAELVHGPRDKPRVALTFHGQGEPAQVRQLLDELERGGARVTVLAVGSWLDAQPAMAKRILDGGHDLGNHTQNHLDISGMSPTNTFAEINTCAGRLRELTGSIGSWFRPSQTQYSTATIREQATRVGYPSCLSYDVDSLDFTDPGPDAVVRNTLAAVQNGSIVSLHFGHAGTVAAIPALLDGLHQRGLRAVTATELMS